MTAGLFFTGKKKGKNTSVVRSVFWITIFMNGVSHVVNKGIPIPISRDVI